MNNTESTSIIFNEPFNIEHAIPKFIFFKGNWDLMFLNKHKTNCISIIDNFKNIDNIQNDKYLNLIYTIFTEPTNQIKEKIFTHVQTGSTGSIFIEDEYLIKLFYNAADSEQEYKIANYIFHHTTETTKILFSLPVKYVKHTDCSVLFNMFVIYEYCILITIKKFNIDTGTNRGPITIDSIKKHIGDNNFIKTGLTNINKSKNFKYYFFIMHHTFHRLIIENYKTKIHFFSYKNFYRLHHRYYNYIKKDIDITNVNMIHFKRELGNAVNVYLTKDGEPTIQKTTRHILDDDGFIILVLQVVFALFSVNKKASFIHYDLKLDNILVHEHTIKKDRVVDFGQDLKFIILKKKYTFKINDYDMAEVVDIAPNKKIDKLKLTRFKSYLLYDIYFLFKSIEYYKPEVVKQHQQLFDYIIKNREEGIHEWRLAKKYPFDINEFLTLPDFEKFKLEKLNKPRLLE